MITLNSLTVEMAGRALFENVSLQFDPERRYGLVGANGSGKSTLLRIIAGEEGHHDGTVSIPQRIRMGFLKQDQFLYEKETALDVVLRGNERLHRLQIEKTRVLSLPESHDRDTRLADIEAELEEMEAHRAPADAGRILSGVGLAAAQHSSPMGALSGGYRLRVLLAQILYSDPDVMLLDEPTNHLDIVSIAWLENHLAENFRGTLIVISHDRDFLNRVCTDIADIDFKTITLYRGNWDAFMAARTLSLEQREKEARTAEKKVKEMEAFVERFKAKASKARQAQSRVKQIEKIEIPEILRSSRRAPRMQLQMVRPSGKEVLTLRGISKAFGERKLFDGAGVEVARGEKIAIVGENGTGKSTLMKIISGELKPDAGEVKWGFETKVFYLSQDFQKSLTTDKTVEAWLHDQYPAASIGAIRGTLGGLLFEGDEVKKKLKVLSGGEGIRLFLSSAVLEKANVLLLDEPTNHLDLESIGALETALSEFPGTVIFVSHDKRFVQNVSGRVWTLKDHKLTDFAGGYAEFLEKSEVDYLRRELVRNVKKTDSTKKNDYAERKKLKNAIQKMSREAEQLELKMRQYETELEELKRIFAGGEIYQPGRETDRTQAEKLRQDTERQQEETLLMLEDLSSRKAAAEEEMKNYF